MRSIKRIASRAGIAGELLGFLGRSKRWWAVPLVLVLLLVSALIVIGQATILGPFIYTIF